MKTELLCRKLEGIPLRENSFLRMDKPNCLKIYSPWHSFSRYNPFLVAFWEWCSTRSIQVRGLPPFIICIKQAMKLLNKDCWQDNFICGSHKYLNTQTYSFIYRQHLLQDSLWFLAWLSAGPVQAGRLLRWLWGWEQHLGGAGGRGEHDPGLQSLPQARQNGSKT